MTNVFMADDIKCEILPRINTRTDPIPKGHYPIVADIKVGGIDFEFCDIFKDETLIEKSKNLFVKSVLNARSKAMKKRGM